MDSNLPSLGSKTSDRIAAVLRSIASTIPFAGGLLTEIINELIPNQRIDRVERFLLALASELHHAGNLAGLPTSQGPKLELFESGLRAASQTSISVKILYLAKCVASGLSQDEGEAIRVQRIMRIISELDPEEMTVLLSYTKRSFSDAQEFREQHATVFDIPTLVLGSDHTVRKRNAEYEAAERHLISLGLLAEEIRFDTKTGTAKMSIRQAEKDIDLTMVGRQVLNYAGLTEEI